MKKLLVIVLTLATLFAFSACEENEYDNVSYRHTAYLVGSTEGLKVIIQSGERESPYIADGEAGELVEFCVITLKPTTSDAASKSYTFKITINGEEITGTMNKDVFGTSFTKDVGSDVGNSITSITFSDGEKEYPIELENMMANAIITEKEALDISSNEFKEKLLQLKNEERSSEIYLKFVCDTTGEESFYYWYVANVMENGDYFAVLIDIVSGDVIAKRQ